MAIRIAHAVSDEEGKITGALSGDQTGKEILTAKWYPRSEGWDYYLECTDAAMADKAARYAEQIAASPRFGYSQRNPNRWAGLNNILKAGGSVAAVTSAGDFDCSSFCLSCYILAGLKIKQTGATISMRKILLATGKFTAHNDPAHLSGDAYAKRGSMYLKEGKHVFMCLENGAKVGLVIASTVTTDQTGIKPPYVEVLGASVNVRSAPNTAEPNGLFVAHKGDRYEFDMADPKTGWYGIITPNRKQNHGYISNRADLTKLVKI